MLYLVNLDMKLPKFSTELKIELTTLTYKQTMHFYTFSCKNYIIFSNNTSMAVQWRWHVIFQPATQADTTTMAKRSVNKNEATRCLFNVRTSWSK